MTTRIAENHSRAPCVALVTSPAYMVSHAAKDDWYLENILKDDGLLIQALAAYGLRAKRVAWSDPKAAWERYELAVLRSTWDYLDHVDQFKNWLERVSEMTQLCNPVSTLLWNMDKHYLRDLANRGIGIIPTTFLEQGSEFSCQRLLEDSDAPEIVIKPCISAAARHTYRIDRNNCEHIEKILKPLVQQAAFMVQPFQRDVVTTGEDTVMVINGIPTHAVRKVAKLGDFRVQDDHGGKVLPYVATPEQIHLACQAIAACPQTPQYGRVDMVRGNDGTLMVMEVEVIEPELWLRFHPPAATDLASAIAAQLV